MADFFFITLITAQMRRASFLGLGQLNSHRAQTADQAQTAWRGLRPLSGNVWIEMILLCQRLPSGSEDKWPLIKTLGLEQQIFFFLTLQMKSQHIMAFPLPPIPCVSLQHFHHQMCVPTYVCVKEVSFARHFHYISRTISLCCWIVFAEVEILNSDHDYFNCIASGVKKNPLR